MFVYKKNIIIGHLKLVVTLFYIFCCFGLNSYIIENPIRRGKTIRCCHRCCGPVSIIGACVAFCIAAPQQLQCTVYSRARRAGVVLAELFSFRFRFHV